MSEDKGFWAKVILDSVGPQENRLTTIEFTIPKLWLAEFNTYCMFARNSASTRAIPFHKQVEMMQADTYVPHEWPLENPGMSAKNNVESPYELGRLREMWLSAQHSALGHAQNLARYNIHKQLAGRLIELWRYQTVLVTADEGSYSNFFYQRRDKAAAPEIRAAAEAMYEAYKASTPVPLPAGHWHCPLIRIEDTGDITLKHLAGDLHRGSLTQILCQVSAARCARLSYLTHHGIRDINEDIKLFNKLTVNGHWSPLEHVCQALPRPSRLRSWALQKLDAQEAGHGKWWGWHQFRKNFPREFVTGYLKEVCVD